MKILLDTTNEVDVRLGKIVMDCLVSMVDCAEPKPEAKENASIGKSIVNSEEKHQKDEPSIHKSEPELKNSPESNDQGEPKVTDARAEISSILKMTEEQLMATETRVLLGYCDDLGIDPSDFNGANTNKKLRGLILRYAKDNSDDKETDSQETDSQETDTEKPIDKKEKAPEKTTKTTTEVMSLNQLKEEIKPFFAPTENRPGIFKLMSKHGAIDPENPEDKNPARPFISTIPEEKRSAFLADVKAQYGKG